MKINKPYKCIVTIPAGRKKYMEVLLSYILKEQEFVDEIHIWMNTQNLDDINYIKMLSDTFDFIKIKYCADHDTRKGSSWAIHNFFRDSIDNNSIYIRLDDDIVWMEERFIEKMYNFRLNNEKYFLVYGNIINNAIMDHIRQRCGAIEDSEFFDDYIFQYDCMDPVGWGNSDIACLKHKQFIKDIKNNNINKYKFNKWILFFYERVSINCISWFGKKFAEFGGNVGENEEVWLSQIKPAELKLPNCINGEALCAHFAFYSQRDFLDRTDILNRYIEISK